MKRRKHISRIIHRILFLHISQIQKKHPLQLRNKTSYAVFPFCHQGQYVCFKEKQDWVDCAMAKSNIDLTTEQNIWLSLVREMGADFMYF